MWYNVNDLSVANTRTSNPHIRRENRKSSNNDNNLCAFDLLIKTIMFFDPNKLIGLTRTSWPDRPGQPVRANLKPGVIRKWSDPLVNRWPRWLTMCGAMERMRGRLHVFFLFLGGLWPEGGKNSLRWQLWSVKEERVSLARSNQRRAGNRLGHTPMSLA